ncbi:MAG: ammonium transporter [Spirochaetaceae bacterium]|nr:MAG: ammonium transporter [Spirochaetaceae bacterium]
MNKKKIVLVMVVLLALLTAGNAFALESFAEAELAFDMLWLILAAALVFFMQAGFAMVETGLTRAKNAGNIIMKNLMDFSAGAIMFFAVGWALMYGTDSIAGLIGMNGFFLNYSQAALEAYGISSMSELYRDWMFQVVFAATAATIVSGAMAERTKFSGYLIYSMFITGLIYPVFGHWTWGGGWLSSLGFYDFAGSTIVHSVGGWAALVGAILLGARKGKYVKVNGKTTVKAIPGHNLPLAALGVFILWFGWYGFNGGSTLSGVATNIASVFTTTTLSAAGGAIAAMFLTWIWFGKPDPSMSLNGALAGLVGITAGADVISPLGSIIVGLSSGLLVVLSVEFIDKVLHIDDPVGAVSVHGVCGAWGTLMVGVFHTEAGLLYGGGLAQLGSQFVGILAAFAWVAVTAGIVFGVLKVTGKLRVDEKEELQGLDISEHGMESYSGFQIFSTM